MKILLLQNIKNVGKKDEIINAQDGYARNFLIPKKLGVPATEKTLHEKSAHELKALEEIKKLETLKSKLTKEIFALSIKTGKDGSVFDAIHNAKVESTLAAKGYKNVKVILERPIKTLGEHVVPVDLSNGIKGAIKIKIVSN